MTANQLGARPLPVELCSSVRDSLMPLTKLDMNATETETFVADLPLPESHQDLELLLQALHALNDALDQYATETPVAN